MLILQIALGIVLGVLILAYLPQLLAGGVIFVVVAAIGVVAVLVWDVARPFKNEVFLVIGAAWLSYFVYSGLQSFSRFYSTQDDASLQFYSADNDARPVPIYKAAIAIGATLAAFIIFIVGVVVTESVTPKISLPAWLVWIVFSTSFCLAYWFINGVLVQKEKRRQWRVARRASLGVVRKTNAPNYLL